MSLGDVLVGVAVGLLDGLLFGVAAVAALATSLWLGDLPAAPLVYAAAFGGPLLVVTPYSYYRFQVDKRYFPVVRRYLELSTRYGLP